MSFKLSTQLAILQVSDLHNPFAALISSEDWSLNLPSCFLNFTQRTLEINKIVSQLRLSTKRTISNRELCVKLFKVHLMWSKITRHWILFRLPLILLHAFDCVCKKQPLYFSHVKHEFFSRSVWVRAVQS